jgi:hypothetical protein
MKIALVCIAAIIVPRWQRRPDRRHASRIAATSIQDAYLKAMGKATGEDIHIESVRLKGSLETFARRE